MPDLVELAHGLQVPPVAGEPVHERAIEASCIAADRLWGGPFRAENGGPAARTSSAAAGHEPFDFRN